MVTMENQEGRNKISGVFSSEYGRLVEYAGRWLKDCSFYDAEDAVQDVLIALIDRADVTLPVKNLTAYVYRSLYNRVMDMLRNRDNTVLLSEEVYGGDSTATLADVLRDLNPDICAVLEQKELSEAMYRAIDTLSDDEKAVIIETELEGSSFQELAEEWGLPIGTLLSRKSRALRKIKEQMISKGG